MAGRGFNSLEGGNTRFSKILGLDILKSIVCWHSSGTAEGQIGLLGQHPRWQVAYNQYALHVGA